MEILIYLIFAMSPFLARLLEGDWKHKRYLWIGIVLCASLSLAAEVNFDRKFVWAGTNGHIPILFAGLYLSIWIGIFSLIGKVARRFALVALLPLHLVLCLVLILPGIWILGDYLASVKPLYEDSRMKAFILPWGWVGSSGADLYVCENRVFLPRILFFQRVPGASALPASLRVEPEADGKYLVFLNGREYREFGVWGTAGRDL